MLCGRGEKRKWDLYFQHGSDKIECGRTVSPERKTGGMKYEETLEAVW